MIALRIKFNTGAKIVGIAAVSATLLLCPARGYCRNVVFLLDTSYSMNESDANRLAPDSVRAMAASLKSGDKAGVIAYNTVCNEAFPLSPVRSDNLPVFKGFEYTGYTNTGEALEQGLSQIIAAGGGSVIIVTDGEIMLPDAEETLESVQRFSSGMERAARENIPVYVLSIEGGPPDRDYRIYSGYAKGETVKDSELLEKGLELTGRKLGAVSVPLAAKTEADRTGRIKGIHLDIPFGNTKSVKELRLLVLSDKPWRVALSSSLPPGEERVRLIDVPGVSEGGLDLGADYPMDAKIKVEAYTVLEGALLAGVKDSPSGEKYLWVMPVNDKEKGVPLFSDSIFEGKKVHLTVNGEETEGTLSEGAVTLPLPKGDEFVVRDVRFNDLGVDFTGDTTVSCSKRETGILPWLLSILAMGVIFFLLRRRQAADNDSSYLRKISDRRKTSAADGKELLAGTEKESVIQSEKSLSYRGKMVLNFLKTPDGSDIPPLEYNLFRRLQGKEITLSEMLSDCGVNLTFQGAENVSIGPLKHGVYVSNASDCTVTKQGDILLKGGSLAMYFNDSVHIAFSDEKSEIALTYKSLKP